MIKLYNSLTRIKEDFKPLQPGRVGLYTCGPTVYHYAHIGNLRSYITWDVMKQWLGFRGYTVTHIMNITDVGHLTSDSDEGEDRMEIAKEREHKSAWDVAEFFTTAFKKDVELLGITPPDKYIPATSTIEDQIAMALKLDAAGYLYRTSDGMYFDTSKFPEYGKLALLNKVDLQAGARVSFNPEKKHATDFAVWKFSPADSQRDMEWESPWGKGFPGWHLECSAISLRYLGDTFDIHTGGIDNLPTHHVNEMAQSQAVTGMLQARWWVHAEHLLMGEKMSKSSGNFLTLRDVIAKGIRPQAYRFYVLQTHYRKKLQFSWESLEAAATGLENMYSEISFFNEPAEQSCEDLDADFIEAMDNDLNTPQALAVLQKIIGSRESSDKKMASIAMIDDVLGLGIVAERKRRRILPQLAYPLLEDRRQARLVKDYKLADSLRKELDKLGVEVKDTAEGQAAVLRH